MYLKKQLQEMNSHQINIAVATELQLKFTYDSYNVYKTLPSFEYKQFSPSNDCNDAITIAKNYKISINWLQRDNGYATVTDGHNCICSDNIPRAICEIFLLTVKKLNK